MISLLSLEKEFIKMGSCDFGKFVNDTCHKLLQMILVINYCK